MTEFTEFGFFFKMPSSAGHTISVNSLILGEKRYALDKKWLREFHNALHYK